VLTINAAQSNSRGCSGPVERSVPGPCRRPVGLSSRTLTTLQRSLQVWRQPRLQPVPRALVYARCVGVPMMGRFWRPWRDKSGSSLIEYAFLIAIAIALIIIGVAVAGLWASGIWTHLQNILG
jgi:Flp pilus assembly pilin Flp